MPNSDLELRKRAKEYLESIQDVSDATPTLVDELEGGGAIVTARLKVHMESSYGWYYEDGDVQKALFNGEEIAKFIARTRKKVEWRDYILSVPFMDVVKITVVSILTFVFTAAVIDVAIYQPQSPTLQVLTGLLGLTIGYFVGKVDAPR